MEQACKDDLGSTETLRLQRTLRIPLGLVLSDLVFPDSQSQCGGHYRRGGVTTEAGNVDHGIAVGKEMAAAAVVRSNLAAFHMKNMDATMMVALSLSSSRQTLSKPLTYFFRCNCTGDDRDCQDAHIDLELLELGDSNRIIVSQDVTKRKTSDPKAPPRLSTTRIPPFLCYPPSSHCMNEQLVTTSPRTVDTNVTLAAAAHCSHHGSSKVSQ